MLYNAILVLRQLTLPKGHGGGSGDKSNKSLSKAIVGVVVSVIVVGFLIWYMITVTGPAVFQSMERLDESNREVEDARVNYNAVTSRILSNCSNSLPQGSYDCDASIVQMVDYCKTLPKTTDIQSCGDSRIESYVRQRVNYLLVSEGPDANIQSEILALYNFYNRPVISESLQDLSTLLPRPGDLGPTWSVGAPSEWSTAYPIQRPDGRWDFHNGLQQYLSSRTASSEKEARIEIFQFESNDVAQKKYEMYSRINEPFKEYPIDAGRIDAKCMADSHTTDIPTDVMSINFTCVDKTIFYRIESTLRNDISMNAQNEVIAIVASIAARI